MSKIDSESCSGCDPSAGSLFRVSLIGLQLFGLRGVFTWEPLEVV